MTTNYVLQILIWSIIIIVICSIGLAIYNGYSFAQFPKAILFAILYILQPLKIILRPLKNLLYYILPRKIFYYILFDKTDGCLIGKGWEEKYRLSTLVLITTLVIGSLSGYVVLNPNKFSSTYGKIMTYILVALSLGLGFKSALLFTHENNNSFRKDGKLRSRGNEEQRDTLFKMTLNYVKLGVIGIVVLAILGIATFYVSINDNVARSANTVISWLAITFGLFIAYLYSKDMADNKNIDEK